jgi:hypothetical protein
MYLDPIQLDKQRLDILAEIENTMVIPHMEALPPNGRTDVLNALEPQETSIWLVQYKDRKEAHLRYKDYPFIWTYINGLPFDYEPDLEAPCSPPDEITNDMVVYSELITRGFERTVSPCGQRSVDLGADYIRFRVRKGCYQAQHAYGTWDLRMLMRGKDKWSWWSKDLEAYLLHQIRALKREHERNDI